MADGSDVTFLPLLRARFDDARVSEFLENAARSGTTVFVPLEVPPRDASLHRLEVHFPGRAPLVLLAEPLGAPRVEGFPLRLAFPTPSLTPPPRSVRPTRSVPPAPGDSWVELPELPGAAADTPSIETNNVAFASSSDWLDEDQLNGPGSGRSHPSLKLELGDAPRAGAQETVAPEGVAVPPLPAGAGTGPHLPFKPPGPSAPSLGTGAPFAPPAARPTPPPFPAPSSGAPNSRSALTPLSPPTPYAAFSPPATASSVMGGLAASAAAAAGVVGGLAASAAAAAAGLLASASGAGGATSSHASAQAGGALGASAADGLAGSDARTAPPLTDEARTLAQFLSLLAETRDVARFTALVAPLEARVRALVDQGDAATARRIHSTLEMIVHEATRANEPRAPLAEQAIRVFSSSRLLAVLAPPVMKGHDPTGDAARILVNAGNKGAHALYSARVANDAPEARERFVALVGEIGPRALPTVASALERLASRLTIPGAKSLAEDVLAVVPAVAQGADKRSSPPPASAASGATPGLPELGAIVARFAQGEDAALALLATRALPRALRDGARPILFEQLHRPHDGVASAALAGLVALGAVDELLFGELRAVVLGAVPSSPAFRLAATNAMASATPEVRPYAIALLEHAVATPALGVAQPAPAPPHGASDEEAFVLAAASALVTAGGNTDVIVQRWMASSGALRTHLEPIVRRVM